MTTLDRSDTTAPAVMGYLRYARLDALRGLAIIWMAAFHFAFDLNLYGYLQPHQRFTADPFWTVQRFCIVSMFLLCAGAGQAAAVHAGQGWASFWRRWSHVAGCAVLVSIGSAFMFPRSWISFGVLHGVAIMSIGVRWLATRMPPARLAQSPPTFAALALIAAAAWIVPKLIHSTFFDSRAGNWLGLVTRLPVTEDYVPVLPWLGMMLAGYLAGSLLLVHAKDVLMRPLGSFWNPMARLGRWPLSFYMLHQPMLIGGILLYRAVRVF